MKYKINGTVLQSLSIELEEGEKVYSEAGGMAWMTDNIEMETSTRGGVGKALGRMLSGESLFLTTYSCSAGTGNLNFTLEAPGKILVFDLQEGQSIIAQKDAFMVAEDTVQLEMHFRKKLGAGFFGGEGFILQKISGPGKVFLEIIGEVVEYGLKQGQVLKVDPGHIALYQPSVNYDLTRVRGAKNILFGGEGLFLAKLEGPGKVWLQTMPLANLAARLLAYLPRK